MNLDGHENLYKYVAMSEALAVVCWATIKKVSSMAAIETERKKSLYLHMKGTCSDLTDAVPTTASSGDVW